MENYIRELEKIRDDNLAIFPLTSSNHFYQDIGWIY